MSLMALPTDPDATRRRRRESLSCRRRTGRSHHQQPVIGERSWVFDCSRPAWQCFLRLLLALAALEAERLGDGLPTVRAPPPWDFGEDGARSCAPCRTIPAGQIKTRSAPSSAQQFGARFFPPPSWPITGVATRPPSPGSISWPNCTRFLGTPTASSALSNRLLRTLYPPLRDRRRSSG